MTREEKDRVLANIVLTCQRVRSVMPEEVGKLAGADPETLARVLNELHPYLFGLDGESILLQAALEMQEKRYSNQEFYNLLYLCHNTAGFEFYYTTYTDAELPELRLELALPDLE